MAKVKTCKKCGAQRTGKKCPKCGNEEHRGGSRPHSGPKKLKPECELADGDKDFATRVLARIGKPGWTEYADLKKVKNDEDYALHLLVTVGYDQFHRLLNRKFGKEVQRVRVGNPAGEKLQLEVNVTSARDKLIDKLLS